MKMKTALMAIFLMLVAGISSYAQKVNFEFINQKYTDILYAISLYRGISIVTDDTVSGNATFQFAGTDFEKAFDSFLSINRLYVTKLDKVWTLSRISIRRSDVESGISLDALDATPGQILDQLSRFTGKTILFDVLPSTKISVHITAQKTEVIAELVMKPFNSYIVENASSHLLIKKGPEPVQSGSSLARMYIEHAEGKFNAEINQGRTSEILDRLCREENIQYSNFIKNDPVISGIRVAGKSFKEMIAIVLEQASAEKIERNGIWYFLPSISDGTKKIRDEGVLWNEYSTISIRTKDALSLISSRFPGIQCIAITGTNSFLAQVTEKSGAELTQYLTMIDRTEESDIIHLKYISTSDFLKALPPSVRKEEITDTGSGSSFFFSGSPEVKKRFLAELEEIDKPKERIRYDMLIIQYENSSNLSWNPNTEFRQLSPGDMTSVSGSFGSLLNVNFDVITLFGYRFSASLNTALSENSARVFADTTLHGITGENIKFQNTSTYRYRDSNVDPETGKPIYTGITREIVSGVVLEINGWVSGGGMVTMNIHASVSKRGVDVSGKSGNPPPTSEKSITTRLNASNGEPVILSGLTENDASIVEQRIPFISRIPLIGWFFRSRNSTKEKTEMVIYLVPHLTNEGEPSVKDDVLLETVYERLVQPYIEEESGDKKP